MGWFVVYIGRTVGIGTTCTAMAVQVERNSGLKSCARVYFKHYEIIIIPRFVAGVHELVSRGQTLSRRALSIRSSLIDNALRERVWPRETIHEPLRQQANAVSLL